MRRAYKTDDNADHCHQEQRDELYNGGGGLELTGKLWGERVHDIRADEIEQHQREALGPDDAAALRGRDYQREIRPAGGDEHEGIARGEPREHRRERGVIGRRQEPADIIPVLLADRGLGIVDDAVDLFVALRHGGKGQDADYHYRAADDPCEDAERHVALGLLENGLRLEEHAGADDYTDDHAYCGEQAKFFLKLSFHMLAPSHSISGHNMKLLYHLWPKSQVHLTNIKY